jgi:hypothetical protein
MNQKPKASSVDMVSSSIIVGYQSGVGGQSSYFKSHTELISASHRNLKNSYTDIMKSILRNGIKNVN